MRRGHKRNRNIRTTTVSREIRVLLLEFPRYSGLADKVFRWFVPTSCIGIRKWMFGNSRDGIGAGTFPDTKEPGFRGFLFKIMFKVACLPPLSCFRMHLMK